MGGPLILLHYNGDDWTKVASNNSNNAGYGAEVTSDGSGGLWIRSTEGESSLLLHYAQGKLTRVALPGAGRVELRGISHVPGSTQELAVGDIRVGSQFETEVLRCS